MPSTKSGKDKARERRLLSVYGITLAQYGELLQRQNFCCAVCLRHKDTFPLNLAVDHDHKTGEVRGLLCAYCNHRLVGRHRDSSLLRRIADYVDSHTGWFIPERKKKRVKRRRKKNKPVRVSRRTRKIST